MDVDVSQLAVVGAELVELGERLKVLRKKRDEVQAEITELEAKLTPLVLAHSKIIASIVGQPVAAPSPPYVNGGGGGGGLPTVDGDAKGRILRFLERAEPGVSALDIATALHLDASIVRNVMRELRERNG